MSQSIAFVICTEPGRLEQQSLLLAESIRSFAGKFKDTPIYSFHPRQGKPIETETSQKFAELNVIHRQLPLNIQYHDYYLANKPLVCAYAEQNVDAEILVFLDSDKCIFNEPEEFILPKNVNVAMRPEYGRGVGSRGVKDVQDFYWQQLYQLLNVKEERFVITPMGKIKIRAYWNSGLIVVRRSAGIFSAWKQNFIKVMEHKIQPAQGIYMVEQTTLSATICALEEDVLTLSPTYSYPFADHNRIDREFQSHSLEELVSIHYFGLFYYRNWLKRLHRLKQFNLNTEKFNWLQQKIVEYDMPFKSLSHYYWVLLKKIEGKLKLFKININLSSFLEKFIDV